MSGNCKPKLLDLYSGAGGCAKGYQMAGFHVTGVDIKPQPRYAGDAFVQADALEYVAAHGHEFDVIHASPECQGYCALKHLATGNHQMQIPEVRMALRATGKPYAIENVEGARAEMIEPLMLCGTMFGLRIRRHRLFECYPPVYFAPAQCAHTERTVKIGYRPIGNEFVAMSGGFAAADLVREVVGIPWMTRAELSQAIPPVFTRWIGEHLYAHLQP